MTQPLLKQPLLKLEAVCFQNALKNLSLAIAPGERVGIIGAMGAGKSTLLRLCNRLSDPTAGNIYFDNRLFQSIPVIELRRQVVLLLQESSLLGMSVAEAIAYPLCLRQFAPERIKTQVDKWTERLQIDAKLLQRSEVQLSTGQRQWAAIARALVLEPRLLLLDEPTANLDRGHADLLMDVLRSPDCDTTVCMVNHQLDLLPGWSDRLVQLERGEIVLDKPSAAVDWRTVEQSMHLEVSQVGEDW